MRCSTDAPRAGARTITPRVDMQYTGQGYVIEVEFPDLDEPDLAGSLRRAVRDGVRGDVRLQ